MNKGIAFTGNWRIADNPHAGPVALLAGRAAPGADGHPSRAQGQMKAVRTSVPPLYMSGELTSQQEASAAGARLFMGVSPFFCPTKDRRN